MADEGVDAACARMRNGPRLHSLLVVADTDDLDLRSVKRLLAASTDTSTALGLLPIAPGVDAGTAIRLHADRASPTLVNDGPALLYSEFAARVEDERAFDAARAAEFLSALATGADAAVIHAHGNGADMKIGNHVLCVRAGHPTAPSPGRLHDRLPCLLGGPCRLDHKAGIVAFHDPRVLRARLLVLLSCASWQPVDGLMAPDGLLAATLLEMGPAAAIVAPLRVAHGSTDLGPAVFSALTAGATIGDIALALDQADSGPPPYVCVGDPELTVASARPAGVVPRQAATRTPKRPSPTSPIACAAAARRALQAAIVRRACEAGDPDPSVAARTLDALEAEERALERDRAREPAAETDRLLAEAIGQLFAQRGLEILAYIADRLRHAPLVASGVDHLCGFALLRSTASSECFDGADRDVYYCERCGPVADLPQHTPVAHSMTAGAALKLPTSTTRAAWAAVGLHPIGVHRHQPMPVFRVSPGRSVDIPPPAELHDEVGLTRWGVALVSGGDYAIYQAVTAAGSTA